MALHPDDQRVAAFELLDGAGRVIRRHSARLTADAVEVEASPDDIARCWVLRALDEAGEVVGEQFTELGKAMLTMKGGAR